MFGLLTGHIHTHKQIKKKCQGGVKCAKLHPCTDTAPLSVVHTDTMKHTIVLHTHMHRFFSSPQAQCVFRLRASLAVIRLHIKWGLR